MISPKPRISGYWPILAIASGALLVLILLLGLATQHGAGQLIDSLAELNGAHKRGNRVLYLIRADLHLSGVLVRDFLLDPSHLRAQSYREQLLELRENMQKGIEQMQRFVSAAERDKLEHLSQELEDYWDSLDPLFDWTPEQKMSLSSLFLKRVVLPRGEAVLKLTREIEQLSAERLVEQENELAREETEFRQYVNHLTLAALVLGTMIAVGSTLLIRRLESQASEERLRKESAELKLRELSRDLVLVQEQERKRLSRELHDEVGQLLTALNMEIGQAERYRRERDSATSPHWAEAKRLVGIILRQVRSIAMGLRPSMLDDLGLREALDWQLREFERRYGILSNLTVDGRLDDLDEPFRTCTYRVVQEALTNCARHSKATRVEVLLRRTDEELRLEVSDNGIGIDSETAGSGFGIRSMEERVRDLRGILTVQRLNPAGTLLSAQIPIAGTQHP